MDHADPSDFSVLEANIETIVAGLRDNVKRIKPGGVDVEAVGEVRVTLKKPGGSSSSSSSSDKGGKGARDVVKVGELAQVVPRGRVLVLLVGEKEVCFSFSLSISFLLSKKGKEPSRACFILREEKAGYSQTPTTTTTIITG